MPSPSFSLGRMSHTLRRAAPLFALAATYYLGAKLGLRFAYINSSVTTIWPPAGIALAGFVLFGYRVWPAIFAAAFFANVSTTGAILPSLGIALGNTAEGLLAAYLVNRFARRGRSAQPDGRRLARRHVARARRPLVVGGRAARVAHVVAGRRGRRHRDRARADPVDRCSARAVLDTRATPGSRGVDRDVGGRELCSVRRTIPRAALPADRTAVAGDDMGRLPFHAARGGDGDAARVAHRDHQHDSPNRPVRALRHERVAGAAPGVDRHHRGSECRACLRRRGAARSAGAVARARGHRPADGARQSPAAHSVARVGDPAFAPDRAAPRGGAARPRWFETDQ